MKNSDPNTKYRHCVDEEKGDCPFMRKNEYNVPCCSIDGIIQVRWYGCIPQDILDKQEE